MPDDLGELNNSPETDNVVENQINEMLDSIASKGSDSDTEFVEGSEDVPADKIQKNPERRIFYEDDGKKENHPDNFFEDPEDLVQDKKEEEKEEVEDLDPEEEPEEEYEEEELEDQPEEEEDESDLVTLQAQLKAQKEQITTLLSAINSSPQTPSPIGNVAEESPTSATQTPIQTTDQPVPSLPPQQKFIELNRETFEEVISSPEAFSDFMNTQMQVMRQKTLNEIYPIVNNIFQVRSMFDSFFTKEENSDLLPVMEFFKTQASVVEDRNPSEELGKILEITANEVREKLGFSQQIMEDGEETKEGKKVVRRRRGRQVTKTKRRPPRAPGTKPRKQRTVKPTGIQSEIDELMEVSR